MAFGKEIKVDSSNLDSVMYDPEEQILRIKFRSGRVYEYYGVEDYIVDELLGADSKGSYFYHNIRDNYSYRRIK